MRKNKTMVDVDCWKPTIKQSEVLSRTENEILVGGSRSGGKTELTFPWITDEEYIKHPEFLGLVIRQDYDDLSNWVFRVKPFVNGIGEVVGNPEVIRLNAGGIIRLGYWKGRDTFSKYIGHEYWKILIEEFTQTISCEDDYKRILSCCRINKAARDRSPYLVPQFLGTTNPGGPGHSFAKQYFVDLAKNKVYRDQVSGWTRLYLPFTAYDNPHNSSETISYLEGLSEPLRSAWLYGNWDCFDGQFFMDFNRQRMREEPFEIDEKDASDRLFGAIDVGITHPTAFGLYYLDRTGCIHRLLTYKNGGVGYTHRDHAEEIYNKIMSFRWNHGYFPGTIWISVDAFTETRNNKWTITSPVEQYREVFGSKGARTQFVMCNNNRKVGCWAMKEVFKPVLPDLDDPRAYRFRYWGSEKNRSLNYNESFVEGIEACVADKDDIETYKKMDGDDIADETRYAVAGMVGHRIHERQQQIKSKFVSIPITISKEDSYPILRR